MKTLTRKKNKPYQRKNNQSIAITQLKQINILHDPKFNRYKLLRNRSEVADLNVDGSIKQGSDNGVRCILHDGSGRVRRLGGNGGSTVAMESLGLASSPAAAAAMEALGLAHLQQPWKRWV
ncbi:uncharacterized protein G2W53_022971 [Senna tora]|uniref:Uncharacterized protein n=1 Tax=Senna tora TaxID=362788 RepID=A0A834WJ76_9FABA|nr:uncharacterized protein G2W53_022971 [Senna tora]